LFLTPTESVLVLRKPNAASPAVVRMKLVGANPRAVVAGRAELPGTSNYFIGNDPSKWRTNVPQYARVEYEDVYRGVNLAYYGNQWQLEYDFIVKPGADPRQIRLAVEGADDLRIDAEGNLVLSLPGGDVVEKPPVVYQEFGGVRKAVEGRFVLCGRDKVGFQVGAYEVDRPLVLDPCSSILPTSVAAVATPAMTSPWTGRGALTSRAPRPRPTSRLPTPFRQRTAVGGVTPLWRS